MARSLTDQYALERRRKEDRAENRRDGVRTTFCICMTVLTVMFGWSFLNAANTPMPSSVPSASPVIVVNYQILWPTETPRPTVAPTPTPQPTYPPPTPTNPECRDGAATPGAVCRMIPVPKVPTPTPTAPPCVRGATPAATPTAYGNGNCIW